MGLIFSIYLFLNPSEPPAGDPPPLAQGRRAAYNDLGKWNGTQANRYETFMKNVGNDLRVVPSSLALPLGELSATPTERVKAWLPCAKGAVSEAD